MEKDTIQPTVLLLDDDHFLLDMYTTKFLHAGFGTLACTSVADALKVLREGAKPIAILFDVVMPQEDGFSFAHTVIKEHLLGSAVLIALTNQNSDTDRAQAEEIGVDEYIIKATMIPSEIVQKVQEIIAHKK
jgi:CheY-like chemotaxis protein